MKNTLKDLNNHLFAQLERLSDEDIKGDALTEEIRRASAVTQISSQIIKNGSLVLSARKWHDDRMDADLDLPEMLDVGKKHDKKPITPQLKSAPKKKFPSHIREELLGG